MKSLLLAALLSTCVLSGQSNPGTGTIEGHVFSSRNGTTLRKATVTLTATNQIRLVAITNSDGLFQFSALPPGTYKLSASQPGFLDHPARRPILLGADEHVPDAEIRLPQQGVIAGHVLDEDGDALAYAQVALFKQRYRNRKREWAPVNNSRANEAGEYRFPNLKPGRYVLQGMNTRPTADSRFAPRDQPAAPKMDYVRAYYPNALNEEAAVPVEVGVGSEVPNIDIHLFKVASPPLFRVRGKVTGVPPVSGINVSIWLTSDNRDGHDTSTGANSPDYSFDLSVPPGQYRALAMLPSGNPEAFATGHIAVTGNVTGVVLAMSPVADLAGRVSVAESDSKVNLGGVTVDLTRIDVYRFSAARSDATGKFTLVATPIGSGHYSVGVSAVYLPEGCFVQTVKLSGQEVSPDDFEILSPAQLEIVLSHTAGKISGLVADADGKPVPNSTIALIPQDGKSRPVKLLADDDAKFTFTALRPGKYTLFAWEEVDDDLWQDPEFRKQYENRATEITIAPSETQTAQLRVIALEEMK